MSKPTPIPWFVSDRPSGHGCEVAAGSPGGPVILFPSSASWLSLDERRANAEIIVRAVNSHTELLEACKAAYDHATADPIARLDQKQLNLLRKAIAKAEGQT